MRAGLHVCPQNDMGGIFMNAKMMLTIAIIAFVFIAFAIEVDMRLSAGWNLVAVPCSTGYINIADLLPIVPPAYKFVPGGGYEAIMALPRPSEGFWVLAMSDAVVHFSCECVDDTLDKARLLGYGSGDSCLGSPDYSKSATDTTDSLVEITAVGCVIHIVHYGIFNCCMDSVAVSLSLLGDIIVIVEDEIAESPCLCICEFEIFMDVQVGHNGIYWIEIIDRPGPYASWSGPIAVTDCH